MKKLTYLLLAIMSFCKYSQAQTNRGGYDLGTNLFFVGYEIAMPTNSNYLTQTSWSGLRLDSRRMVTPNVSVGIAVSFNSFEQYFSKQTYQRQDGTGAVTGDMIRRVYTSPITVSAHYYLEGKMLKPYIGLGLGMQYATQNAYFNVYEVDYHNWGFVARPEFGLFTKLSPNVGGYASVAYNYSTNKNGDFHISSLTHVPVTIGLVFTPD